MLIDWCDTLHFEHRSDGQFTREDLGPALPPDDLVLRAARALQQASGHMAGAHIGVHKLIPAQAGMGGGSSDAASTCWRSTAFGICGFRCGRIGPNRLVTGCRRAVFFAWRPRLGRRRWRAMATACADAIALSCRETAAWAG